MLLAQSAVFVLTDRVISKLNITSDSQLSLTATRPEAVAIAGAVALQSSSVLHLSDTNKIGNITEINDAALV